MRQIIAIGGGGFMSPLKNFKMEIYLLKQTKKDNPKICFLPQASNEAKEYIVKFYETFCSLGAKPSWISLFGRVEDAWKEHLLEQDIIYVGGGNTRSMLALWREWGMDKVLQEAYKKGIILSGVSAGAICWFEQCITDSVWPLGALNGLKFIKGSCCPHYDSELERRSAYQSKVRNDEVIPGIALEDYTAAHFIEDELNCVITSVENKRAFKVTKNGEEALNTVYLA